MIARERSYALFREVFEKDRARFTDLLEKELLEVRKKEDLESVLELFTELKNEVIEVSPFLATTIHPVLTLMIKNHYYKQIAEHADLFQACANSGVCALLNELVADKKEIRFLTQVENYRLKKLTLALAEKFKENDIVYRLELELLKEDLEWRDGVE